MKEKDYNIYPAFEDEFKCMETYKLFTQGTDYKITAFGTEKRNGVKIKVWWITNLEDNVEFSVIKTTVNTLIKANVLKLNYESI